MPNETKINNYTAKASFSKLPLVLMCIAMPGCSIVAGNENEASKENFQKAISESLSYLACRELPHSDYKVSRKYGKTDNMDQGFPVLKASRYHFTNGQANPPVPYYGYEYEVPILDYLVQQGVLKSNVVITAEGFDPINNYKYQIAEIKYDPQDSSIARNITLQNGVKSASLCFGKIDVEILDFTVPTQTSNISTVNLKLSLRYEGEKSKTLAENLRNKVVYLGEHQLPKIEEFQGVPLSVIVNLTNEGWAVVGDVRRP